MVVAGNSLDEKKGSYPLLWLFLILALGFVLRWMQLELAQGYCFNMQGDGILACSVAVDYEHGDAKAQYIGQPNYNENSKMPGPLWTLFCLAGLKLAGSPQGILWQMLLLNTATIYLAYLLAKKTIGQRAALWTAFFIATFPRVITFSIPVYNPNVMPFFGTLMFLALWQVTQKEKSRAAFWLPFIPMLALQFHMSGLVLIPTAIIVIFISKTRLNYLWLAGGFFSGALLYLPYIGGEMANDWQNTTAMWQHTANHFSVEVLKVISSTAGFFVSWSPGWIRADREYVEFGNACFGSIYILIAIYLISTLLAAFLIAGITCEIKNVWRNFQWQSRQKSFHSSGVVYLSLILGIPLLLALLGGKAFHARYCLVFEAPLFALAAAATMRWLSNAKIKKPFGWLLGITIVTNLWITIATDFYQNNNIAHGKIFTPSFKKLEAVYQQLKTSAGSNPIAIDDADYLKNLPPKDMFLRDASLIKRYVEFREKEISGKTNSPTIFKLEAAGEIQPTNSNVRFYGNGIALVAE